MNQAARAIGAPSVDELADLRAELAGLAQRVETLEAAAAQRQRLKRGDARALAALLPVVAGLWGSEEFLSRELAESNHVGLRLVLSGRTTRSIGRLLSRAAGIPVDGYVVDVRGEELNVKRWSVAKVI